MDSVFTRMEHSWRWLGTALCFLIFGVGGLVMGLVFPLFNLLPMDEKQRRQRAQRIIHYCFRSYIRLMRLLGVLYYRVENQEKLRGARVVLANHPSLIDVVFLIAFIPQANCVVKSRLMRNPVMRGPLRGAGYILNESPEAVIASAKAAMAQGETLIVFPEGTRTDPDGELRLRRGAANIALRTESDITPVLIRCTPTTLTKKDKWYHVPKSRVFFRMKVIDSLEIAPYISARSASVAARTLTKDLAELFTKELAEPD